MRQGTTSHLPTALIRHTWFVTCFTKAHPCKLPSTGTVVIVPLMRCLRRHAQTRLTINTDKSLSSLLRPRSVINWAAMSVTFISGRTDDDRTPIIAEESERWSR